MSSRVIQQQTLGKGLILIALPALVGIVGKLWSNITGQPADAKMLVFAALIFLFGSYLSWNLSKKEYPLNWIKLAYKISAGLYLLMALSFIVVSIYK